MIKHTVKAYSIIALLNRLATDFWLPDDVKFIVTMIPSSRTGRDGSYTGRCSYWGIVDGERQFEIEVISTCGYAAAVEITLHEFRHAVQRVNGWIVDSDCWYTVDHERTPYHKRPHEIDAREFATAFLN